MLGAYQYQPITGPVWREPVADRLAWLPVANYAPRALAQPPRPSFLFNPLPITTAYDPALLDWLSRITLTPRALPYPLRPSFVVIAEIYDSQVLDWQPQGAIAPRALARIPSAPNVIDLRPPVAFDPATLTWLPSGQYVPRTLASARPTLSLLDPFPRPAVVYDPSTLEWLPSMNLIIRRLERSHVSWFVTDPVTPAAPVTTRQVQRRRRWHRSTSG